ncbi:nuclear transport factor 2 family protein [Nocardia transvalensis]|uniref:nuclear transport factor 2 family protein n=1 Tax=Nocardia transvalensis TaxID=37333 RepID=UPI00189300A1|nr:nuclear transport factor 2 family protein [Nocardia transvalensis]MBF6330347.1 nuclear transport factor 2 family protein [Nocardia transvalensis]
MSATASAAELLAAVEQSPQAIAVHDRAAWLELFAPGARVEDPVGSRPHVGEEAIGRFYDTLIASSDIAFRSAHDVVCGTSVFRDLAVETRMAPGVTLRVPMHLRYDLAHLGGEWKIRQLRAHWELPVMSAQLLAAGVPGVLVSAKLGPRLLANQGIGGALGFARGFIRVSAAGKRAATGLLESAGRGSTPAVRNALAPTATLEWPAGTRITPEEFVTRAAGIQVTKPISAGRYVTTSVETTTGRGIAELELSRGSKLITTARLYVPD